MELNNIKSNVPLPIGSNLIYEQLNSDAKYQNVILNAIQDIAVQSRAVSWACPGYYYFKLFQFII